MCFVITEQKKYISGVLRNIGFALLALSAFIVFQWIVFKKSLFLGHSSYAVVAFLLAWVFVISDYAALREKK